MKLLKKDTKPFLNTLYKLTDNRFKFVIVNNPTFGLSVEMYFCNLYTCSSSVSDLSIASALDCLIDLIIYADKQNNESYFNTFGVSFELYLNRSNGKDYFRFRKTDCDKWVKINYNLASMIVECKDISVKGLRDNVVSYREYDCYYNVNIKG